MPYLGDLAKETSLMFVNTHFSLNLPKPNSPEVIEVGGMHIVDPPKPIEPELKKILDAAKGGFIYMSWGSLLRAETLAKDKREHLLKAFASLNQTVLWKFEGELPGKSDNVITRKWMPQVEILGKNGQFKENFRKKSKQVSFKILAHSNCRAFLTHGGLLGSNEAAYYGVPVIITPMSGDAYVNAASMKKRGMGVLLRYEEMTAETITAAIKKVLEPSVVEKAKELAFSFRHRPVKPIDLAVWWIDYVATMKGSPLTKSSSTYLSGYVYHSLDVYSLLAAIVVGILTMLLVLIKLCCCCCCPRDKMRKENLSPSGCH